MGKDRPPSYSRDRGSSRGEYRSMTRSPSPRGKPGRSSRKNYSRSSSSSSSSYASDNDRRSRRRVKKHGGSSPIVLQSSPERGNSVARSNSKWLESSPNFQPMTPPSPPKMDASSTEPLPASAPAPPPMESQPIPSFQREDNYRSSGPPTHGFPRGFQERFSYGNYFFQGGNSSFLPPDTNSQHGFDMNNLPPPPVLGLGPPMVGAGPPPNMMGNGPPHNMANTGPQPPPNILSGSNMARAGPSTPNMAAPWETPQGNFQYGNAEFPPPNPGMQQPPMSFNRPPDVAPPHPTPSPSNVDVSKPNAVEQELVQQKRTLAIQREEYFKKKISLTRDLKSLKDKKRELQKDNSKGSEKLFKENLKLQDEIEQKLKSLDSVIEMLTHIIGDKDEIEMLLKETSRRSESPPKKVKKKRSRSKSPSRSKSEKKRSPPRKRSSSPHVNIVHYDPELHWCSVCNVFPRSATVYLVHLHSEQHKAAVKNKKDKEKPEEEFAPWRVHEKREPSPPSFKNAPSRRVPIRGVPFLTAATAWYCSMCKMWLGDLEVANRHLRGEKHAANYSNYVTDNPHWEVDWLRDRTRAYERNSETRSGLADTKDEKSSKKESKIKDASEHLMSTSDVTKLEERLMALISANNAAQSKEGSSREKNRERRSEEAKRRSSSRSDRSDSDSSGEEKKERKKKKKNKKKKKFRDSRERSAESDDHKKSKRRDKSAESDDHKKGKRREKSEESDDHKKGKRRDEEDEGGMRRKWDDDRRKDQRGGVFDRLDRDRDDARDRMMNAFRGRGRVRGRGDPRAKFDTRRLINRNPIWRPTNKDRVSWDNPKEKLAVGRNVFGLDPKEYYGPEAPPKKDDKK
uniref:U1-type domain-containing protein n=2 Tax=Lygus hesperus TaxID=30085 RepID=A0A0K8SPL5_LYGHE